MTTTRFSMRTLMATLTLLTTAAACYAFGALLWAEGPGVIDLLLLVIFAILVFWLALAFWTATFGLIVELFRPRPAPADPALPAAPPCPLPRTAVIMPVYNEDPAQFFAGLLATCRSVIDTAQGAAIDYYVLSDSTNPEIWLAEELAWAEARSLVASAANIYYRHRDKNTERKSGNIRDFCQRWGGLYEYIVVLDADSIMTGQTVIELIRRMEANPKIGLLQTSPLPVNRHTVFARMQQFAASVYGPVFASGYALWTHAESNYWGHNAILRARPFIQCCGLPTLPGPKPLGGQILSHDFVEAALLRRAGWEVHLASDLAGSYEECPTTIADFATRSRRWCQGNLQHLRLILLYGFHPVSRVHFGMGAMAYISSVLWLLFILLAAADGIGAAPKIAVALLLATLALLFLPKFWGYLALFRRPRQMEMHGGPARAACSVLLEALLSSLIAPMLMIFNTIFVISIFAGSSVQWDPQRRGDSRLSLLQAIRLYGFETVIGLLAAILAAWRRPATLPWLIPVLAGLILSIPLAMLVSNARLGRRLARLRLFLTPEEVQTPPVLAEYRRILPLMHDRLRVRTRADYFCRLIVDPAFNDLHIGILRSLPRPATATPTDSLRQVALHGGPAHLTQPERFDLLLDEASLRWLHLQAWSHWPLDARMQPSPPH